MPEVLDQLKVVFANTFGDELLEEVGSDNPFLGTDLDSLDRLEFVHEVEEHFNITLFDSETVELETLRQLAEFIAEKKM